MTRGFGVINNDRILTVAFASLRVAGHVNGCVRLLPSDETSRVNDAQNNITSLS
jgi:hypothetical protein